MVSDVLRQQSRVKNPGIWNFEPQNFIYSSPIKSRLVEVFSIEITIT